MFTAAMTLKDLSSLPARKRHQISGPADFLANPRPVCSSMRHQAALHPGAVLPGAPEMSSLAL